MREIDAGRPTAVLAKAGGLVLRELRWRLRLDGTLLRGRPSIIEFSTAAGLLPRRWEHVTTTSRRAGDAFRGIGRGLRSTRPERPGRGLLCSDGRACGWTRRCWRHPDARAAGARVSGGDCTPRAEQSPEQRREQRQEQRQEQLVQTANLEKDTCHVVLAVTPAAAQAGDERVARGCRAYGAKERLHPSEVSICRRLREPPLIELAASACNDLNRIISAGRIIFSAGGPERLAGRTYPCFYAWRAKSKHFAQLANTTVVRLKIASLANRLCTRRLQVLQSY